jgi:hypothetical protein
MAAVEGEGAGAAWVAIIIHVTAMDHSKNWKGWHWVILSARCFCSGGPAEPITDVLYAFSD